jgi:hypothetical protein
VFPLRNLARLEVGLALALWATALGGLAAGQPQIRQYLYFFAWYPYILFLDGMLCRLHGKSRLWSPPRGSWQMFFWSVTGWLIFEALNLVLKDWGYVGVTASGWVRWPGYALAFATVLPGVLLTCEVLAALGLWGGRQGRPLDLGAWQPVALLAGVAFLVMPLVFPHYAFPLVWVALVLLLDPFCDLLGGSSLIAGWAAGRRQEGLCLMSAGLICGLWWEMWNYPATSKWVYTLPVLNFGKIFEMPLLGYLGFIPFALECAVMYNFFKILEARVLVSPRLRRRAYYCQIVFWLLMFAALDRWTVISFQY